MLGLQSKSKQSYRCETWHARENSKELGRIPTNTMDFGAQSINTSDDEEYKSTANLEISTPRAYSPEADPSTQTLVPYFKEDHRASKAASGSLVGKSVIRRA
ncbi:hypothetical protein GW17_00057129 [Ensete ventricosum]|nr:hypothetical protein GW17_00057129 [Ensete ventricosum]